MKPVVKKGIFLVVCTFVIVQLFQEINKTHNNATLFEKGRTTEFAKKPNRGLASSIPEDDRLAPKAAWLMSFPMSGADYAIATIHKLALTATATNYGNVIEEHDGVQVRNLYDSVPLFSNRFNGPFLYVDHMPLPKTYIPVTTYCTGYAFDCYPGRFAGIVRDQFARGCVESTKFISAASNNGENAFGSTEILHYAGELIAKAAIMVRNPFDVIEERFLYSCYTYSTHKEWIPRFEPNARGFHNYCAEAEQKYGDEEEKWYDTQLFQDSRNVPCHIEFIKLVFWFNKAHETAALHNLIPYYINYEKLADPVTYGSTAINLLSFFDLSPVVTVSEHKPELLAQGPTNYLTAEEKLSISNLIRSIATPETLAVLEPYLT